ncbi:MAG: hypothetical protein WD941_09080, partial [Opitutus sp.]
VDCNFQARIGEAGAFRMILTLRAMFLGRALREKLLVFAFVAIGLLWWGSAFAGRTVQFNREQRTTTSRLNEQQMWIDNRAFIEANARETAGRLDPARTLNANQLAAAIAQLANEAGLGANASSGGLNTQVIGQFAMHSLVYTIRNVDWEKSLRKFYVGLQQRAPYVAIEQFAVVAAPNNPAQLTVQMRVVSFEIVR